MSSSRAREVTSGPAPASSARQQDVLFRGQGRDQLERLKNKPNFAAPNLGHPVFGKSGDIFAIQQQLAAGGIIQSREQAEQRAFAASRRPHDRDELAPRNGEIDAAQNLDPMRRGLDGPGEPDHFDDGEDCR